MSILNISKLCFCYKMICLLELDSEQNCQHVLSLQISIFNANLSLGINYL